MNKRRGTGVALCIAGLLAVCLLATFLPNHKYGFASVAGIEDEIEDDANAILSQNASGAEVTASGRDLSVVLPETVGADFDRLDIQARLNAIDLARPGKVEILGDPEFSVPPGDAPDPEPTVGAAEPTPVPATPGPATPVPATAEPATPVPATPEPATPAPSTPEPAPPSLIEIVAEFGGVDIEFEPGTAQLTASDTAQLDDVAILLEGQTGGPIQVQAHTDDVGDPDVNLLLSADRADAVTNYLIDRGVEASLLSPRGFGSSQPIADNDTEQGRADNRRVAFVVEGN